MNRFFGIIRKRLLGSGKFSKYLFYAAGEIILVVIGILIALQVNNWNQNRIKNDLQIIYLKGILSDIETDIKSYQHSIRTDSGIIQSSNYLLDYIKNENQKNDSVILSHLSKITTITSFDHRNIVMEDMKSSGRFNLIESDSIRQQILEYYFNAEQILEMQEINNQHILEFFNSHLYSKVDVNSIYSAMNVSSRPIEVDSFDASLFYKDKKDAEIRDFIDRLSGKVILTGFNSNRYKFGLEMVKQLKRDLTDYLKSIEPE